MRTVMTMMMALSLVAFSQSAFTADEKEHEHAATEQSTPMMHQHMQAMHTQMEKIHASTNPEERKKLMHEHMQSMREAMAMMGDMQHSTMQGGEDHPEQGMDMMQMMMGQMEGHMKMCGMTMMGDMQHPMNKDAEGQSAGGMKKMQMMMEKMEGQTEMCDMAMEVDHK